MEIHRDIASLPAPSSPAAVTLGNFDGVHLGHQRLFEIVRQRAKSFGGRALVLTFRPHPVKVLAPDLAPPLITTYDEKLARIAEHGLDATIELTFDAALASMAPEDFVREILVARLGTRASVVGFDFTFGRNRSGNANTLRVLGERLGFDVHIEPAVQVGGMICSSTKVREFILEGRVRGAAILLGRDFTLRGTVVRGAARGKSLGFPTANMTPSQELLPKPGVYACLADAGCGRHRAVVNVGYNPTFQGRDLTVEAHLLDFQADLYESDLTLHFRERLRDEKRFSSADALVEQIRADVLRARGVL